jgi:hypothetical protein
MIRLLPSLLAGYSLLALSPSFDEDKLPYRGAWGTYIVVVNSTPTKEDPIDVHPQTARILDSKGRELRVIRDYDISVSEVEMTGKEPPELHITGFGEGAHCCRTDYYFTRDDGSMRNLLILLAGNTEYIEERDLNGDGRREIIVPDDAFAYFDGLPYNHSPWMNRVIGWNGKHYVEMTRRYPSRVRADAKWYRDRLWAYRDSDDEDGRQCYALGYYANALLLGDERTALRWIRRHAPQSTRNWLIRRIPRIRKRVSAFPQKFLTSQSKVLAFGDEQSSVPE